VDEFSQPGCCAGTGESDVHKIAFSRQLSAISQAAAISFHDFADG
jgi:hypothetical protein